MTEPHENQQHSAGSGDTGSGDTAGLPAADEGRFRRKRVWAFAGAGGIVVLAALVALIVGLTHGPSQASAQDGRTSASADDNSGDGAGQGKAGHRQKKGHNGLKNGQSLLLGTVTENAPGKLTVTRDGGGPVTVTTDNGTKAGGSGVKALTDLKPGQRVAVKVDQGKAVAVRVPAAKATGTVTGTNGDSANLVEPDGLVQPISLSGVQDRPKDGDLVIVTGTIGDAGKTFDVTKVRQLPHAG
jgi:hypothetical protein